MNARQVKKLTDAVFLYLDGERLIVTESILTSISEETEQDAKLLYKKIPVTRTLEKRILETLRVPQNQYQFYVNQSNLLELLTHLHQDGYASGHLGYFLALIDKTKYHFYRRLGHASMLAFIFTNIGVFFALKREKAVEILQFILNQLPQLALHWIQKTFSLPKNLTFIGLSYNLLRYFMFLYDTFYHGFSNLLQKITAVSFRTLATGLSVAAYGLIFSASGIATPLSGLFFIASSFVGAIESFISYLMIRYQPAKKETNTTHAWLNRADEIREENQKHFITKEMLFRVFLGLVATAVVAAWCFFAPQTIVFTLIFMGTLMLLARTESFGLSKLQANNAKHLQKMLEKEYDLYNQTDFVTQNVASRDAEGPDSTVPTSKLNAIPATKISRSSERFFQPLTNASSSEIVDAARVSPTL